MIKNADIDAFINLVDSQTVDIEDADGSEPLQTIVNRIHSAVCVPSGRSATDMRALHRTLFRRSRVGMIEHKYADKLQPLFYFSSNELQYRSFNDCAEWIAALADLRKYGSIYQPISEQDSERDLMVIGAINRLQARGYGFKGIDEEIHFANGEMLRCANELFSRVKSVDGLRIIVCLLEALRKKDQFSRDRYQISRIRQRQSIPSRPFGYLLNLAFANVGSKRSKDNSEAQLQDIFDIATDMVAVLDLETYSPIAYLNTVPDRLSRYIYEISVGDHAFTFRQIAPNDGLTILRGLFSWVDNNKMLSTVGWNVNHAVSLAEWTFSQIDPGHINGTLSREAISESGIDASILQRLLSDFSHDPAVVNVGYRTPLNATYADATFKPFFRCVDGRYLIPAPSISSIGFYEAIAKGVRATHGPQTDQKIGEAIEPTLAKAFQHHGINPSVVSCKYNMFGVNGECDIVIETDSTILLIELKKKPMTRASQAGNSEKLFADLFKGIFETQSQLGQHELMLHEHGHIKFLDGSLLKLAGRSIERLAVTLMDWGSTQDRMVLRTLANTLIDSSLSLDDASSSQSEFLKEANGTLKELRRQQNQLQQYYQEDTNWQFSNWWFLSVPQILYILDEVTSAQQFYERLRTIRQIIFGSLDFYQEYEFFNIRAAKAAKKTTQY